MTLIAKAKAAAKKEGRKVEKNVQDALKSIQAMHEISRRAKESPSKLYKSGKCGRG